MPHAPITPSSVWWARTSGDAQRPPLADRIRADVAVIGAGVVGMTVAHDLAVAGHDVVVLEAGAVGAGATGHTTAKLTALQSPRYARLARQHGDQAASLYAQLSLAALARVRDAAGDDADIAFESRTAVTWTSDDSQTDTLRSELDAARRAGLAVRTVADADGLPIRFAIGLDEQGQFDPLGWLRSLARRAEEAGARIFEASPVRRVSLRGATRDVETDAGAVIADRVVVATGLPILDRGGWFARCEPHRSYATVATTPTPPTTMAIRTDGPTRSSRPVTAADGSDAVLVAGSDHRTGRGGDTRRRYEDLAEWARERFDAGEVVHRWSAQDWTSVDGLPLAGELVPGDDRVLAACAFDKWGLTSGTAAAGTLVRRITGQPRTDVDRLLSPARLDVRASASSFLRHNAVTGWAMTGGWLRAYARTAPSLDEGEGAVHRDGVRPVATSRVRGVERSCSAVCTHLGGIVAWEPGDGAWACPLHGSRFDPSGRVLSGPAVTPLHRVDGDDG